MPLIGTGGVGDTMADGASTSASPLQIMLGNGSLRADPAWIGAAAHHHLDLMLCASLVERGRITSRARAEACEALKLASANNQRLLEELLRVVALLDGAGVPALPLKGPALALLLWDNLGMRRCRDIDILVPEERVPPAVEILRDHGYRAPRPAGGLLRQIHLENKAEDCILDLHWNVAHGEVSFRLDFDELWTQRQQICIGATTLPQLCAEWLFVVMSIYLVKGYPWPELIYLSDIARLIERFPGMDWHRVGVIAKRTGTRRICAVSLALVSALPGAAVPETALRLFPPDETTLSCARRIRTAAGGQRPPDVADSPACRVRRILGHTGFRECPGDKLQAYASLMQLLLRPHRAYSGQGWTAASAERLARLAGSAATGLRNALFPSLRLPPADYAPAPGTIFYPLDDQGLLLVEGRALYALSPSAVVLWRGLEENQPVRVVVRRLAASTGRSLRNVLVEVRATLHSWRETGLLGPGIPATSQASPRRATVGVAVNETPRVTGALSGRRRYRLLGTIFEIGVPAQEIADALDAALGHLTTVEAPDVAVVVARHAGDFLLVVDGCIVERCQDPEALIPLLKSVLSMHAVNREDFGLCLHAAMLRKDRGALLLPAPSQSGKTCLAAALAKAGFEYCADEITLLDRYTFEARGLGTALAIKAGAWQLLHALYPELEGLPLQQRTDGKILKYLPLPPSFGPLPYGVPTAVRLIVFPNYLGHGGNALSAMSKIEALHRLMDECIAMRLDLTPDQIERLIRWLGTVSCYSLKYDDLSAAGHLLQDAYSEAAECRPTPRLRDLPLANPTHLQYCETIT